MPNAISKWIVKSAAKQYRLRPGEGGIFNDSWHLYSRFTDLDGVAKTELEQRSKAEVLASFTRLSNAVGGGSNTQRGHKFVARMPIENRRYVVFSDHHITFAGHRQNFFHRSGNMNLYAAVLKKYADAGFTLVENGDVEDLVVYDPKVFAGEAKKRRNLKFSELQNRRQIRRLDQLDRILADSRYKQQMVPILQQLDDEGRWIRVVGNHDYDLQRDDYLDRMRAVFPNFGMPFDYLLLDRAPAVAGQKRPVSFAVLHGHQFDSSTNPAVAPIIGEVVSECLGGFFQGGDREWAWRDRVDDWALGRSAFRNLLVTDDIGLGHEVDAQLDALGLDASVMDPDAEDDVGAAQVDSAIQHLGRDLFEALFKHNVAWEYFEHANAVDAVVDEVLTGDEWFKFRHLNEELICDKLVETFPSAATRPTLLLGHSHEPRFHPRTRHAENFAHYLNSGAAGRWENLLWGVEIDKGAPRLVSWSMRPDNDSINRPFRRVWAAETNDPSRIRASVNAVPIPA